MYWLQFLVSSVVIIVAGIHVTHYADRLSAQLNLGKAVVGVVLLGFITSLPEAITCIVAVKSLGADDLAVGNLLGSNNFNPLLIVLMDMVYRRGSVTNDVIPRGSLLYSAGMAVVMTVVAILEIAFNDHVSAGVFSPGGVMIVGLYIFGMRRIADLSAAEVRAIPQLEEPQEPVKGTVLGTLIHIFLGAIVVVGSAMVLARAADMIAESTGLGRTFVGSIFLAIVTSLPEVVVTLSAMKMGSFDLAVGNIFGSNMTNLLIIVVCTFFNPEGPVLMDVTNTHILTAIISILLVVIAVKGIQTKGKRIFGGLAWDTWTMLGVWLAGTTILYWLR